MLLRAAVEGTDEARAWIARVERDEVRVLVPDLIWAEVGQALRTYVRGAVLTTSEAEQASRDLQALRLEDRPLRQLLGAALGVSLRRGLSVYDACYVALADASEALLVTADRGLIGAYGRVELLA